MFVSNLILIPINNLEPLDKGGIIALGVAMFTITLLFVVFWLRMRD